MSSFFRVVSVCVALGAASAWAQLPPVNTSTVTYQPLSGATPITFDDADEGFVVLPLPFSFSYFGQTYSQVWVHTNGLVGLKVPSACGTATHGRCTNYSSISSFPKSTEPNAIISPFWDDMKVFSNTTVQYASTGSTFSVEFTNLGEYTSITPAYTLTYTVTLHSNGLIDVIYGPITGSGGNGHPGYEDAAGTTGANLVACGATTSGCTVADVTPGTMMSFFTYQPLNADLVPDSVQLNDLQQDVSGNISVGFTSGVSNLGKSDGTNYSWNAWVSRDRAVSTDDKLLATGGPLSTPGLGHSDMDGGGMVTGLDAGTYYVLFEVNPLVANPDGGLLADGGASLVRVVDEATYANNLSSTSSPFVFGTDIVAQAVSGPTSSGPGNSEDIQVKFANVGTVPAANVPFRILLSSSGSTSLDGGTYFVYDGARPVSSGQTVTDTIHLPMPSTPPVGDYYYMLQIDPAHTLSEASTTNNVVASSGKVHFTRADIVVEAVDFIDPASGTPTRSGRFGDPVQMSVRMSNAGGATARNFWVAIILSSDNALSLLSDTLVLEQQITELAPGPAQTFTWTFTLPFKDRSFRNFPTGNYFAFAAADSRGDIGESNETNNNLSVGPLKLYAPGPDLIVSTMQAPASAGVGETIPVFRAIRNVGNVDAPAANYRYYISANNIITPDDLPLQIIGAGGTTAAFGTVTLLKGTADSASEMVRLPVAMTPGTYYVGCIIDPENAVTELSEANNAAASVTVQVAGSSLHVATSQVPDAVVGRPYLFRLAATGESGASTWAVDEAQGALPVGLSLSADGMLSGTPTGAGGTMVTAFTAVVTNAGRTAAARLAMRVLPQSALLDISSTYLPPVVSSTSAPYQYNLAAVGGVRPYAWSILSGLLPGGLALQTDGTVSGTPRAGIAEGTSRVTFQVRDATGSTATKELPVRVVGAGSIVFRTTAVPDGLLGEEYSADIGVQNVDGSALAKPLTFTSLGALPPGLDLSPQSEVVELRGKPLQAGVYPFTLIVEDAKGRTDTMDFSVYVYAKKMRVTAELPAALRPGEQVNVQFKTFPTSDSTYSVVSGALPPGLSLGLDGALTGTVATENADGTWSFVVEAHDKVGNQGITPFGLVVELSVSRQGCASVDANASLWAVLAVALFGFGRRCRVALPRGLGRTVAGLAVAVVLAAPMPARAQYTVDGPNAGAYQPLPSGVGTAVTPTSFGGIAISMAFPFSFYGTPVLGVSMSRYGYLALFGADDWTSSNPVVPHNSSFSPDAFIAPWWDSTTAGSFKWAVLGTAPNRMQVFEWANVAPSSASTTRISFQAILYEGTNRIRFSYGTSQPGTSSASIGIQRALQNGVGTAGCGSAGNCSTADFPANQTIDFLLPPDLTVTSLSVDPTGYAGVAYHAAATVKNMGGRTTGATVRFYLSSNNTLDSSDLVLGDATAATVASGDEVVLQSNALIPSATPAGTYFVFAMADPDNQVLEQNESNNVSNPGTLVVASPKPDLTVTSITAPGTVAPGGQVQISRTLANVGNSAIGAFKYSYYLSDNAAVTVADVALSPVGSNAGLADHATDVGNDTLVLPANLVPGPYWIGVCVNYDSSSTPGFQLDEISWLNNCVGIRSPIVVTTGSLTVTTTTLPAATQFSPYGLRLGASGGDGSYLWTLTAGSLPTGLSLSASGDLLGSPAAAGTFSFTVKVASAGIEKSQDLSLTVAGGNLPLVVVDQDLPSAEFGRAYNATLVAVGGKPPYVWTLKDDTALPVGLALATDGHIEGRAQTSVTANFKVEVQDAAQTKVSKALTLKVVNPTVLSIATRALATGLVKHDYLQPLMALGGKAPYTWTVTSYQQLAENPTQEPGPVANAIPDTLGLTVENGSSGSFLKGVPKLAGSYQLMLHVVDGAGTEDNAWVQLYVTYTEGLAITTLQLPDAFIGNNYVGKLSNNGHDLEGVKYSIACVKTVTEVGKFACADTEPTHQLPPGITLGEDGSFGGGAEGPEGIYSFLVQLQDANGRTDVRGLSIRVRPNIAVSSGCTAVGGAPWAWALVVAGALAGLRRRR